MSGGRMPSTFWEADELGLRGGVDYGTVATTHSRELALSVASRRADHASLMARQCRRVDDAWSRRNRSQPSTLFELTMGLDSRGCELEEFSQCPGNNEVCYGALTGIEVRYADEHEGAAAWVDYVLMVRDAGARDGRGG